MTITTETNKTRHVYSVSVTRYPFDFPVLDADHLKVYESVPATGEGGITAASYEATGIGDPAGGYIEFNGPSTPIIGNHITIVREVPYTQEVDYLAYDPFPAETHEGALDKLTMLLQQHAEELGRTIQSPVTGSEEAESIEIPPYTPNGVWMYDEAGNLVAIDILAALAELSGQTASRNRKEFAATQGQQVFECNFAIENEAVFYNGNFIPRSAYSIADGALTNSQLTLAIGCEYADDIIEVVSTSSVMSTLLGAYLPLLGGVMEGGIKMNEDKPITFGLSGSSSIRRNIDDIFQILNADAKPMQFGVDNTVIHQINDDKTYTRWLDDAESAGTLVKLDFLSINKTTGKINIAIDGAPGTINFAIT